MPNSASLSPIGGGATQTPREVPKVGDKLIFQYFPYGYFQEHQKYSPVNSEAQYFEVEVTGIKKAVISFE
jgi:hypothetical protein